MIEYVRFEEERVQDGNEDDVIDNIRIDGTFDEKISLQHVIIEEEGNSTTVGTGNVEINVEKEEECIDDEKDGDHSIDSSDGDGDDDCD